MPRDRDQRPDSPESKSDASPSGPGVAPRLPKTAPADQTESERQAGKPRNTPPDNEFDDVETRSNE